MVKVSESSALRELRQLTKLDILEKVGSTGRAAHHIVAKVKPVMNPSIKDSKGDVKETSRAFVDRAVFAACFLKAP